MALPPTALHFTHWYPPVSGEAEPATTIRGNTVFKLDTDWEPPWWPPGLITVQVNNPGQASARYSTARVAGEEASTLGTPALEQRSAWVTVRHRF